MQSVTTENFGLLIAYVVPGATALVGASYHSETIRVWLTTSPESQPTIAGFLYLTLAAVMAGLTVGTIRWAVVDRIHHLTGIRRPSWDFQKLQANLSAYQLLEQNHYRFYQFYGGEVVGLAILVAARAAAGVIGWLDIAAIILAVIFFAGSRDTIRKYYDRVTNLFAD